MSYFYWVSIFREIEMFALQGPFSIKIFIIFVQFYLNL